MKIILLGPAWPYRGGIADFSDRLAKEYKSQGCEVEEVTFTLQYPKFLFPGKTQYNDKPAPADWPTRRMMNSINPLSWLRTGLYLRRQKADIIVSAFWLPFMAPCMGTILRLAKRKGTRRIGLLHNLIPHEHRIGDKLFARYFIKSNDAFISLSKSVLDDISTFDSKKPRGFCPHPLYDHYGQSTTKAEARKMLGLDNDGRYALFFGFIRGYKGLDLLLEAIGDERLKELNVKLLVAGEFYDDPKPYTEQIERLGIGDRVTLRSDFIADNEVGQYFCACDIVTQPYKSATQSGVTQIAFHFERPMLVTDVGGLAEIVHNGEMGYVVKPEAKQIADALVDYYSNSREEAFTTAVREEKKKYSWDKLVETIDKLRAE